MTPHAAMFFTFLLIALMAMLFGMVVTANARALSLQRQLSAAKARLILLGAACPHGQVDELFCYECQEELRRKFNDSHPEF